MNGTHKTGAVSLDGRYLFVVGQQSVATKKDDDEFDMSNIPLGLQVIDTKDGSLVQQFDTQASQVSLSRDGKTLLLNGRGTNGVGDQGWTDEFGYFVHGSCPAGEWNSFIILFAGR